MQPVQARATASLIAALAVFGALLFASTALAAPKEGPTGPTGATGATGATGPAGPEGKTASCLPSKATETGLWSASLSASAGGPQAEAEGVGSYPIPLCKTTGAVEQPSGVEAVYLTEKESEEPFVYVARGCEEGLTGAGAQPGHLCLFTGSGPGAQESLWKNVGFRKFEQPDGIQTFASPLQGFRAAFWTKAFREDGIGTIPAGGAYLAAGGAWAVTAP